MRNLKKFLAVIVTIAIMATMFMVPAFAEETAMTDAEIVTSLGLLVGTGDGVTDEYLETQPTRLQAAHMHLRLLGLEAEAIAYEGSENFSDAEEVDYDAGVALLAYLYDSPDLGWLGDGDDTFRPNDLISAKEYTVIMLKALGYAGDFTWETVNSFAAEVGLVASLDVETFTMNDLAVATVEALQTAIKGEETTLVAQLVADEKVDEDAATEAGIYVAPVVATPTPVAFAVASVAANNLKEAVVTFSVAGTASKIGDKANYLVNGVAPAAAVVSSDNMTVTLTSNAADILQQGTLEVKVKKETGIAADTTVKAEKILDVAIPVVESLALTGPKEFTLTFSEPMKTAGTITINNGVYGISSTTFSDNRKVVTVAMSAALTDGTSYDVKVIGSTDYAGFAIADKTLAMAYVKDTSAPTVELVSAKQTEVKVKFNKKVFKNDDATRLTKDYFYHTYTAWGPVSIATTDDQSFTLTFKDEDAGTTDYYLPEGNVIVTVLKAVGDLKVKDAWGNVMAADAKLTASIAIDNTAPTAIKVEATAEDKLEITFDEDVTTVVGNYAIKKGADAADTGTVSLDSYADKKATLKFTKKLAGGTYTVEIKDVADKALTANKIVTVVKEFTVSDKTAPTVAGVVVETIGGGNEDPEYVYLTYSEAMITSGVGSILDLANYQLDGAAMPSGAKVEQFMASNAKVKLTIPKQTATLVGNTTNSRITVGQVADASGNKIVALATRIAIADDSVPTIDNIKTVATNKVSITVTGLLDVATVTADGITIDGNGAAGETALASIVSVDKKDGKTTIVAILNASDVVADTNSLPASATVATKWKSETGKVATANGGGITYTDGIAPKITAIAQTGTKAFTVTFDEAVKSVGAQYAASDFVVVDPDGKVLVPGADYSLALVDGTTTAVITLSAAVADGKKVKIDTKDTVVYIKDNTGAFTVLTAYGDPKEITVDAAGPVATVPAATGATNDVDSLVITFNEALYVGGVAVADNDDVAAQFTEAGGTLAVTSATYDAETKTVTLVLANALDTNTLTMAGFTDAMGNALSDTADVATYTAATTKWALN